MIATSKLLRDGASAQYGSDAIAGVINIILDDSQGPEGSQLVLVLCATKHSIGSSGVRGGLATGDGWIVGCDRGVGGYG